MDHNTPATASAITRETLLALFRRTAHFMARACHHQGHAHHAQRHVLSILEEKGPVNQRDLLELLGVRSASLSELLGKLERNGLVSREKDDRDRRNVIISMTGQGAAAAKLHQDERQKSADAIFASLSTGERQQLGELLIKVLVALEDAFPDQGACRRHHGGGCHGGREHGRHGEGRHGRHRHGGRGMDNAGGELPERGSRRHGPDDGSDG